MIAIAGFFLLHTVVAGFFFVRDMRSGAADLRGALRALRSAEMPVAEDKLQSAAETIARARERFAAPGLAALAATGPFTDDADAIRTLAVVAEDVARAGIAFTRAVDIDGADDVYNDGTLDLAVTGRTGSALLVLQDDLLAARDRLSEVRGMGARPIRDRVDRTARVLATTGDTLDDARSFLEMIPAFAGADRPKRYFVAFQSPSEARGGGGLIGVYGILEADDGRFELTDVDTIETLVRRAESTDRREDAPRMRQPNARTRRPAAPTHAREGDAPRWFIDAYRPFGALEDWRQVNLSPNFPVTARLILDLYEADVGARLDGVVALDPLALGELTRGTGPLVAPGWNRRITRVSARRFLLHDIYRHFDYRERAQNEYLNGLIDAFWDALGSDDVRVARLMEGLSIATRTQHLKVYARDPLVQQTLAALDATGDYTTRGATGAQTPALAPRSDAVQLLFNNNFSGNKVDFFLKRTVDTMVSLRANGSARVTVSVELENEADEAPPGAATLVRPFDRALPFGTNRMLLGLITPEGSIPGTVTRAGRNLVPIVAREGPRPVLLQVVEVPAGETVEVVYRYMWPAAWVPDAGGEGTFSFTLWPQATVRPDFYSLTVEPPPPLSVDGYPMYDIQGRLQQPIGVQLPIEHFSTDSTDSTGSSGSAGSNAIHASHASHASHAIHRFP